VVAEVHFFVVMEEVIGKKNRMVLTVGDDEGAIFRVQCVFPNMESEAVPNEK
jgi:hypothetical protein